MAETTYSWPSRDKAGLLGGEISRIDGIAKNTGAAKYSYDIEFDNQLIARALGCPHGHCKIKSVDGSAAERVPGVAHVHLFRKPDDEISWEGELIAAVAAETEAAAAEGVAAIKVEYEVLAPFIADDDLEAAEAAGMTRRAGGRIQLENEPGDDDDPDEWEPAEVERLIAESAYVVEADYGIDAITHCCLESHGATVRWDGPSLIAYLSTQNVSGTDEGFASALEITSDEVEVRCDYIGGGFGSKFAADYWATAAAQMAKATGRPVQFMLPRDQELKIGGARPSGYIHVRLGADEDGVVQIWDSHHWGTSGATGGGVSQNVIPYVFEPKNYRREATAITVNAAPARAWRAPNHPQACAISQTAYDDLAAAMGRDSYDVFKANLPTVSNGMADVYAAEMEIAAELMDWKAKWHPHGKGSRQDSVVEGLGMAIHTWGGAAGDSSVRLRIQPDGAVETFCGTQDLGTGTRTACGIIVAQTLGLPLEAVRVNIGNSKYPASGPSGGSTTIGGISESHRRVSQDALAKLFALVAPQLEADPSQLEAADGRISVVGDANRSMSWQEACQLLGMRPMEVQVDYVRGRDGAVLSNSNVGGVQMAHVAVDVETGVVRMKKFVAVQDIGLVVNRKTARTQVHGAVVMGIAFSLFEQRLLDPATGAFINCELSDYKLPRLGDVGEVVVEFYEPDDQRSRGVIGLGEPPVISPGAAISNAVCNALGVRVPTLPMTPDRVLAALQAQGRS